MQSVEGIPFPDIDPIAFSIFGILHIRWYALAYLAGFLGGWAYGAWLSARFGKDFRPNRQDLEDMLPWIVAGVVLGGRLGYVLFYNFSFYLENPLQIFYLWEGGMSFHGGMAGVIAVLFFYGRRAGIPLLQLADLVACVVPIGVFFGRLANFANGELFGRVTAMPWGIVFPYGEPFPRHPSQLYEALLEGLVLFLLLYVLARFYHFWKRPGMLSGVFLAWYGAARFCIEWVREPDAQLGLFAEYFSMGQMLSLPMIAGGIWLIRYAAKQKTVENHDAAAS